MLDLHTLSHRIEIEAALFTLMHAVDERDFAAALDVLTDEIVVDYTDLRPQQAAGRYPAAEVVAEWQARMAPMPAVHHHVSNVLVTIDGDRASSKASVIASHRRLGPTPDTYVCWHLGALYRHGYVRQAGRWKIASLAIRKLWDRTDTLPLAGGRSDG